MNKRSCLPLVHLVNLSPAHKAGLCFFFLLPVKSQWQGQQQGPQSAPEKSWLAHYLTHTWSVSHSCWYWPPHTYPFFMLCYHHCILPSVFNVKPRWLRFLALRSIYYQQRREWHKISWSLGDASTYYSTSGIGLIMFSKKLMSDFFYMLFETQLFLIDRTPQKKGMRWTNACLLKLATKPVAFYAVLLQFGVAQITFLFPTSSYTASCDMMGGLT